MAKASQKKTPAVSVEVPISQPPKRRGVKIKHQRHPDTRPCPSWCYVGIENDRDTYDHEILEDQISEAVHSFDKRLTTRASLYPASTDHATRVVEVATFVTHLRQVGAGEPIVGVGLRQYPRTQDADGLYRRHVKYSDLMDLTVEDARELAAMLTYVCDLAERG